ncbi:MAG TPA: hypothetical protein VG936_14350 [Lacunisphaera sp.]|nr:hypothetical protein [Lacunisphaera sp.]
MSDPNAHGPKRRSDLLVGLACVLLFVALGAVALTKATPNGWRLDPICSGRVLARHAIVGGLMLLGPIGAELLLTD